MSDDITKDQKLNLHRRQKRAGEDFKQRRFEQWNENYEMYRDKIKRNRLTQRQAVNIPVIRETIKSWLSNIDEPPEMKFEGKAKGSEYRDKDIMLGELWKKFFSDNKLELLDQMDKKIVALQGRSIKRISWNKERQFPELHIEDPYDILVPKNSDPFDFNNNDWVKRINIFKKLKDVLNNKTYDKESLKELSMYYASKEGMIKAGESYESYEQKQQRLQVLGADMTDFFTTNDTIVELNVSYDLVWHEDVKKFVRHMRIYAADQFLLADETLKNALGIDKIPMVTWSTDPDLIDFWNDGVADSVRPINKVINIYFSQDIENRAYRNFGMFFYNTLGGKFIPKAFDPRPFGMYGLPGDPREMVQQVEIQPLSDTTPQIDFLKNLIQSSVAQTPTERGQEAGGTTTLGEIKLNLQQSTGMNSVDMKHYRKCWEDCAELFVLILQNNQITKIKLDKKGNDNEYRSKEIGIDDWNIKEGYKCIPIFKKEKDQEDEFEIQKTQYIQANFADNPVALKLARRKQLEALGWSGEEIEQVMAYDEQSTGMQPQDPMQDATVDQQAMRMDQPEEQLALNQPSM